MLQVENEVPMWRLHQDPNPFVGSPDKTKPYRGRNTYGTMNDIYDTYDAQLWTPTPPASLNQKKSRNINFDPLVMDVDGKRYFKNGDPVDGPKNYF